MVIIPARQYPFSIWVWDPRRDRVQTIGSFSLDTHVHSWHLDADEDVLVTFEINWDEHPALVQQTKWTLTTGEQFDRKTFPLLPADHEVYRGEIYRQNNRWRSTYGHKTVTGLGLGDRHTSMLLTYDYAIGRLSVRWIVCPEPIIAVSFQAAAPLSSRTSPTAGHISRKGLRSTTRPPVWQLYTRTNWTHGKSALASCWAPAHQTLRRTYLAWWHLSAL